MISVINADGEEGAPGATGQDQGSGGAPDVVLRSTASAPAGAIGRTVIGAGAAIVDEVERVGEEAIASVENASAELVHEALRKLGAVHVAFDHLEVSLGSEIRNARDNVASAIISVARHIAG